MFIKTGTGWRRIKNTTGTYLFGPIWTKISGNQPDASPDLSIHPWNPYSDKKTPTNTKNNPQKVTPKYFLSVVFFNRLHFVGFARLSFVFFRFCYVFLCFFILVTRSSLNKGTELWNWCEGLLAGISIYDPSLKDRYKKKLWICFFHIGF